MTGREPNAQEGTGRHGDSGGGLSVAELIARSRAEANAGTGEASTMTDAAPASAPHRPRRHLTAVAERDEEQSASSATVAIATVATTTLAPARVSGAELPPELAASAVPHSVPEIASAPVGAPRKSKAGRNMPAAIGVGVTLGGLVLLSLFTYKPSFVGLIILAVGIGVYELVTAFATVEARPPLLPLVAGGVAMVLAAWFNGADGLVGALLLTVLGVIVWRLGEGAAGYLPDVASGSLIAVYLPFLAGFAALMAHPGDGAARIVLFILAVVCSDTGGFAAGVLFGKHPMAPMVSPKKSWEGFAGSVIGSSVCGALLMTLCFHHEWWKGVLFGVAVAVAATLGDLGESMIKRDLGLKDMGHLLPGHGGIMDRLDSLLVCAPVAYLLMAAFLPTR